MKRKLPKWSGVAALVLLAGALGVLAWQGSRHLTAASGNTPARLAAVSETVTDIGTLPAEESQPCPQTAAVTRQTETSVTSDSSPQTAVTFPLELNAAGAAELEQLPGIGAVLAQRIVAYRTQIGGFSNREQLLEVEGIGAATLEGLNGWIFVLPLDLNRAGEEDLMQLPDMQPALAAEIVAFRERITAFSSVYELLYVDGMTEAYFTEIRDSVQIYGDIAPE